jgi:hypothetical protein
VHFSTLATDAKSAGFLGVSGHNNIFIGCDCDSVDGHFSVLSYQ